MAYTWTDGELITMEKLNNTGNPGYTVVNERRTILEDVEVTPIEGSGIYTASIKTTTLDILTTAPITLIVDENSYELPPVGRGEYGEIDAEHNFIFTTYPYFVAIMNNSIFIFSNQGDWGRVSLVAPIERVTDIDPSFKEAANRSIDKTFPTIKIWNSEGKSYNVPEQGGQVEFSIPTSYYQNAEFIGVPSIDVGSTGLSIRSYFFNSDNGIFSVGIDNHTNAYKTTTVRVILSFYGEFGLE